MTEKFNTRSKTTRPGFMSYHSIKWMIDKIDDEELGRLYRALWNYSMYEEGADMPEFGEFAQKVFEISAANIDRDEVKYNQRVIENRKKKPLSY